MNRTGSLIAAIAVSAAVVACADAGNGDRGEPRMQERPAQTAGQEANSVEQPTADAQAATAARSDEGAAVPGVPDGISKAYLACVDDATGTVETAECVTAERDVQDRRLNGTYRALLAVVGEAQKDKLVQAQRAWLALKDADDAFEVSVSESSQGENLSGAIYEVFFICERANQLDRWLKALKP